MREDFPKGMSEGKYPVGCLGGIFREIYPEERSRGNIRVRNVQDLQHDYKVYTCSGYD